MLVQSTDTCLVIAVTARPIADQSLWCRMRLLDGRAFWTRSLDAPLKDGRALWTRPSQPQMRSHIWMDALFAATDALFGCAPHSHWTRSS
ncbi:hypothetical protein PISMIDRAFT_12472 [Pisolithus microcarpus 441]|uniref:Unplaced genomic scaffold scaffold_71, whole genome shotgun sequence n=1 Tax=Pisolithus microcarpus 441 TaxID=765257 RepID=A0A0C9Y8U2_9AGAM|nr:hypothetical protein PISMIDRAFT_12472 [Pisolithus microcarpus 441]